MLVSGLLSAALLAAAPAHAAAVGGKPASDAARCIVLGERMPEITAASRQMFRSLETDKDPQIAGVARAMSKMLDGMEELAPLLAEADRLQRAQLLETIRSGLPKAQQGSAAAVMDTQLEAARREYSAIRISADDPELQKHMDAFKAEHARRCRPDPS